ncbi:putative DNA glycosylase At3g47830 isoform X1 [Amborella trichopoda]|uniref:putative DNA glycosylase At3g47830 isoform X1 n=1 Tax=Amborella trichopoda TaxID=13333 RepID=UPI0005D45122|nr:putative DNA glycosylase At3g47830 isoform X1 [Amborella trichopoda]|eukprot:XP_011620921.1 putative DNA glycosylase At3g47830 isoform X1 [Amborella trichopoda]
MGMSRKTQVKKRRISSPPPPSTLLLHHSEHHLLPNSETTTSANPRSPYPNFQRPTPQECLIVRDALISLHGFPEEFAEFRRKEAVVNDSFEEKQQKLDDEGEVRIAPLIQGGSVLDGLVSVILSQNTTDVNSRRAFESLKLAFPTWEDVHAAESKSVVNTIKCGGLAETKASCIKNILSALLEQKGKICLDYLREMPIDKIKAELRHFKGVGPKTALICWQVACVLMFYLQKDDFPVDTHVFRIVKAIGWVPSEANREKAYLHLNSQIPDDLKFDLNCLLVTHGKHCEKCTKGHRAQRTPLGSCPLSSYYV